mmetsp:Transcript_41976/g.98389  ORF Transcript_41976/g.98389 Transcript_41976/m.98389 type:complete len:205 (-) Transcript_41976:85-699(-)
MTATCSVHQSPAAFPRASISSSGAFAFLRNEREPLASPFESASCSAPSRIATSAASPKRLTVPMLFFASGSGNAALCTRISAFSVNVLSGRLPRSAVAEKKSEPAISLSIVSSALRAATISANASWPSADEYDFNRGSVGLPRFLVPTDPARSSGTSSSTSSRSSSNVSACAMRHGCKLHPAPTSNVRRLGRAPRKATCGVLSI